MFFTESASGSGPVKPAKHVKPAKSVRHAKYAKAAKSLLWSKLSGEQFFNQ